MLTFMAGNYLLLLVIGIFYCHMRLSFFLIQGQNRFICFCKLNVINLTYSEMVYVDLLFMFLEFE